VVRAVDQVVAVIVDAVAAHLWTAHLAGGLADAVEIRAVNQAIAVVVPLVVAALSDAGRRAQASRLGLTVAVGAVDHVVAVVILAIAAILTLGLAPARFVREA